MPVMKKETGVKMTKKNRLAILKGARKILSDKNNWTHGRLRRKVRNADGYRYCLLGAVEQAAYDTGLLEPTKRPFSEVPGKGIGYILGLELSLETYAAETRKRSAYSVNDMEGYQAVLALLDEYIDEVKAGRPRKTEEA